MNTMNMLKNLAVAGLMLAPGIPAVQVEAFAASDGVVNVTGVEPLYAAVNNPANAGAKVVMAPGVYALSANDAAGIARPNSGRLELQLDMSLQGSVGDPAAVVIDGSELPDSSYKLPVGRTAPVRIGRGSNAVEWLTVRGNAAAAAGIDADLAGTARTWIRVANTVCGGSPRAIDLRNTGTEMMGRRIDAEIVDNECFADSSALTEGIRSANFSGADFGEVHAKLSGNRVHGFTIACLVTNNGCSFGNVQVQSNGDRFEKNQLGCLIVGVTAGSAVANFNTTTFEAHGSAFINNTGLPTMESKPGGVAVFGVDGGSNPTGNIATASFWDCRISDNQSIDFKVFGARSTAVPPRLPGPDNHAVVELHGINAEIDVSVAESSPVEPTVTDTVSVLRFPQAPVQVVFPGGPFSLNATAPGTGSTYQWFRNGAVLSGQTQSTLLVAHASASDQGSYTAVVTNSAGSSTTTNASPVTVSPEASRLINFSCRLNARSGQIVMPSFVVRGTGSKQVLLRAVGPGLAALGVSGVMNDPQLKLFSGATQMAVNDNWDAAAIGDAFARTGAFTLPAGSKDAALRATLPPGEYTLQVSGVGTSSGVVLIEVYDADGVAATSKLVNAAVRGNAGPGADPLIMGFVVKGTGRRNLLIRGAGPALTAFNVLAPLAAPQLSIYDTSNRLLARNRAWGDADSINVAGALVGAFPFAADTRDTAALLLLAPAAYTAQVASSGTATGEALIEIYEVP